MSSTTNKDLIRRLVEDVWNRGQTRSIREYFGGPLADVVQMHHRELMDAFSDVRVEIEDIIAEDDRVAARLMVSGVHDRGVFAGREPTDKRVGYASFRFYRIADGKVVETWAMQDRLGLLQQLGAIPEPETDVEWADQTE